MTNDIKFYGKGDLGPHPKDSDPNRWQLMGLRPKFTADFNTPTGLSAPPDEDQGSSSSCTWQEFGYYFWQWTGIQLSRQDGYSRTVQPGGGGYLIDPFRALMATVRTDMIVGSGCYNRQQHLDPSEQTEPNMTIRVYLPGQSRSVFKLSFWYIPIDINAIASAMKNYKGCAIAVTGSDEGWANPLRPRPPLPGERTWGHALYCYDIGIYNSQPQLVAKSSWCNWIKQHFISNAYFASGNVYSPIAMQVEEIVMSDILSINFKGKVGLMELTDRGIRGDFASSPAELKVVEDIFGAPGKVLNPDGTFKAVDVTIN